MIILLVLTYVCNVVLVLAYLGAAIDAFRARQERDQYQLERDRLVHFLQRKGWLAAFEQERTTIFRDPERHR